MSEIQLKKSPYLQEHVREQLVRGDERERARLRWAEADERREAAVLAAALAHWG